MLSAAKHLLAAGAGFLTKEHDRDDDLFALP
jgi:hypothetical protein